MPRPDDSPPPALERSEWVFVVAAMALALALRLAFFRGVLFVDDFNYLRHAAELWKGQFSLADALYLHATRFFVFVPIAGLMALFGPTDHAAAIWPLVAALTTLPIVYRSARLLFGREAARYTLVLAVILPLMVDESTRILPGALMNVLIAASLYAFLISERGRSRALWLALSGAAYGATIFVGELGLLAGCLFPLAVWIVGRHRFWSYWPVAAAFVGMAAANIVAQWGLTGDPFFKSHISQAILLEEVPPVRPLYYVRVIAHPLIAHGGVFYAAGSGALVALFSRNRRALLITSWMLAMWLLMEYASTSITQYRPLYKMLRYTSLLSVPGVLLGGFFLAWMRGQADRRIRTRVGPFRTGPTAVATALVALLAGSLLTLQRTSAWSNPARAQFEKLRHYVEDARPGTIYVTHWLWNSRVAYFTGFDDAYFPSGYHPYHALDWKTVDETSRNRYVQTLLTGEEMAPGLLIQDEAYFAASEGERYDSSMKPGEIPPALAHPPAKWTVIDRFRVAGHDLTLYKIPAGARWPDGR